jgi:hypothetical protein
MSFNLMQMLEEMWRKHEKIDPLAHKVINADIKRGSRLGEHFGHFIGSDWLANEAKQNQENPNRAAARGAVGTACGICGDVRLPLPRGRWYGHAGERSDDWGWCSCEQRHVCCGDGSGSDRERRDAGDAGRGGEGEGRGRAWQLAGSSGRCPERARSSPRCSTRRRTSSAGRART